MAVRRTDVARLAGTSPAVVSYVVNGGPRPVSAQTRAKVLAAIEQLGYRPNGIARSLRMSRTMTLGLVIPDNANPFFAELARAIEEEAFAQGYTLLIGNAAESDERQTTYVRTFLARQVDGLFIVPAHGPAGFLGDLERARTPWVCLDRQVPGAAAPGVLVDNRGGAFAATRHLLDHGRRRIACVGGPRDVRPATDRVEGWRDALDAESISMPVVHAPFGRRGGYGAARELLGRPERPDAVFVASDEQAVGVLRAIAEAGLRCPDDVAVASFDGIPGAAYTLPALTTMAQPIAAVGRAAVNHLLTQPTAPTDVLPVTLVRRGSCGCPDPPGGDPAGEEAGA
ncbi:LacI family DNA-binding transcriptional regulator [Asanoa sp. WMMD1127]|uniref:LacI family DNA-binding transcriptional regulator n=1 Tax=Asanoa sp. WMMD1127 TaxID=3016107 RepID=UPI0024179E5F|nr:LacI family DNA-binding transcriptional regulator [Asanoa sp. WMMD1127]MDG4825576.1 LacI family DNA-binding transcriptional regulator [Asanoa sp. WMMD1127]